MGRKSHIHVSLQSIIIKIFFIEISSLCTDVLTASRRIDKCPTPWQRLSDKFPTVGTDKMTNARGWMGTLQIDLNGVPFICKSQWNSLSLPMKFPLLLLSPFLFLFFLFCFQVWGRPRGTDWKRICIFPWNNLILSVSPNMKKSKNLLPSLLASSPAHWRNLNTCIEKVYAKC